MTRKLYFSVLICIIICISTVIQIGYYHTFASEKNTDVKGYDDETMCAIAMNGIEYNGVIYFTKDNMIYRITPEMTKKAQIYLKNVDTESGIFENDGYIYFKKVNTKSLLRVKAGEKKKELVSRGVSRITDIDEEYIYFWGKKFFYKVKTDGSSLECLSKNKLNHPCPNEVCSTVCVFDDMLFYSKGFKAKNDKEDKTDHKLCVQNLETKSKKTLLNPAGCNGSFFFYKLDGKLFVQYSDYGSRSRHTYIYNSKTESFDRLSDADQVFNMIVGTDGKYLYAAYESSLADVLENTLEVNEPQSVGTWKIYRIGTDWKEEYLFDIKADKVLAYSILKFMQESNGYYIFNYWDERAISFCVDSDGNIVYSQGFNYVESKKNIQFDDGTVDMVIKDGILYTLSHSLGIYVDVKTRVIS